MAQRAVRPRDCFVCTWEECVFRCFGWGALQMCFLTDLSADERRMLGPLTVAASLSAFRFMSVSICLTCCGVPMWGARMFVLVLFSPWIEPLITM